MVNHSLARGLTSRALQEYRRMSEQFMTGLTDELRLAVGDGHWNAKRANLLLKGIDKRVVKRSFLAFRTERPAHAEVHLFAPFVYEDGVGSRLSIDILRFEVNRRRAPEVPDGCVALQLGHHAVERMFMRLRTMVTEEVRAELRSSLTFALPLRLIAEMEELKQVPVPTKHGLLLCDGNGHRPLLARTWLRHNEVNRGVQSISKRWERVNAAIIRAQNEVLADPATGATLLSMAATGNVDGMMAVAPPLMAALAPFEWLKEPYEAAPESERDVAYELALEQAQAA